MLADSAQAAPPSVLEIIECEGFVLTYKVETKTIAVKGPPGADVALVQKRINESRDEIVKLLKERQSAGVEIEIPAGDVPPLVEQREGYVAWFMRRDLFYRRTAKEVDAMFAQVKEGELVQPDFALSFRVVRPDGTAYRVDRLARVTSE
jgi:hypothetical protein